MGGFDARVRIDNRQRGSLSAGYNVYAGRGNSPYMTDVSAEFREMAACRPEYIREHAERFDRNANNSVSFLQQGNMVAQFTMGADGQYRLGRVYDMSDPRPNGSADQFQRFREQLIVEQQNMDPLRRAQIDARHNFENLSYTDPGVIAGARHVYPNSLNYGVGEAYLIQNVGGRDYGAKYGMVNGRFEMRQLFDLQDPSQARAFEQQEIGSLNREMSRDRTGPRGGSYGYPTPYPIGRGGVGVDVGIESGRRGSEVRVGVGDRGGFGVGVDVESGRRGAGGQVDVRLPGVGRIDVGIFKPPHR
jgi:hypothetical protein